MDEASRPDMARTLGADAAACQSVGSGHASQATRGRGAATTSRLGGQTQVCDGVPDLADELGGRTRQRDEEPDRPHHVTRSSGGAIGEAVAFTATPLAGTSVAALVPDLPNGGES